ncbi:MAG TPA: hypothetical protein VFM23_02395 [Gemmatimonadales bacterium]|nr:hypothetical protein [Gemmatimonadales bacterium]
MPYEERFPHTKDVGFDAPISAIERVMERPSISVVVVGVSGEKDGGATGIVGASCAEQANERDGARASQ